MIAWLKRLKLWQQLLLGIVVFALLSRACGSAPPPPPPSPPAAPAPPPAPAGPKLQAEAARRWLAAHRGADPKGHLVADAALDKSVPDRLVVLVGPGWIGLSKSQRLELATLMWQAWAKENLADQPDLDRSRIKLVSQAGRDVGGSRALGGSLIYVED